MLLKTLQPMARTIIKMPAGSIMQQGSHLRDYGDTNNMDRQHTCRIKTQLHVLSADDIALAL